MVSNYNYNPNYNCNYNYNPNYNCNYNYNPNYNCNYNYNYNCNRKRGCGGKRDAPHARRRIFFR